MGASDSPPRVIHHGAFAGVTGSCHELFLGPHASLLIDCGLFQGAETSGQGADSNDPAIDFPLDNVHGLVITHTHIDHVGRVPYLLMAGFNGPIYCTSATAHLLPLVIEDALKIGLTRDRKLISAVLKRLHSLLVPMEYDEWRWVAAGSGSSAGSEAGSGSGSGSAADSGSSAGSAALNGVRLRLRQAGHILGSAYAEFEWNTITDAVSSEPSETHSVSPMPSVELFNLPEAYRVVFSGDLGCRNTPLLPDPQPLERADLLFLESTYGDRLHESRDDRTDRLRAIIERCVRDRGAVLIPAFSIGRTQELLYEIEDIIASNHGFWPKITVILDSPMAAKFTALYRKLSKLWDQEALQRRADGRNPLDFSRLHTVDSHADHEHIVNHLRSSGDPCIVIAASGMCAGGRMVNYLKALLPDPRTDVIFVGYQAAGTPGRDIQQYGPDGGYVDLDHQRINIRAGIHTIGGYSAHADQRELVAFVESANPPVTEVRLIHGDHHARHTLTQTLRGGSPYNVKTFSPEGAAPP
ncbi:MBL fold metallo-hydrolase RNA specificity domain-containing protein [Pseudidiomarina piscicola]|uniref:MBL fold metallo-hydrolase RNA specificity domain-containing protein n=1 Tax=Pseudidiomarina piscicola TaxID=2614830 RepID=UPI001FE3C037|nr:MBL fold metallo-hydrolase [Pseudidiomarina piscicola]